MAKTTIIVVGSNDRGFVRVDWNTMRADQSNHRNVYGWEIASVIPARNKVTWL
jgi:hypothetical protein